MLKPNAILSLVLCVTAFAPALAAEVATGDKSSGFEGPLGLQLYSLRAQFAKDVPGTLDKVRDFGIKDVELAGTYGLTPEKFKSELESRGLTAVSAHYAYERFRDDI